MQTRFDTQEPKRLVALAALNRNISHEAKRLALVSNTTHIDSGLEFFVLTLMSGIIGARPRHGITHRSCRDCSIPQREQVLVTIRSGVVTVGPSQTCSQGPGHMQRQTAVDGPQPAAVTASFPSARPREHWWWWAPAGRRQSHSGSVRRLIGLTPRRT